MQEDGGVEQTPAADAIEWLMPADDAVVRISHENRTILATGHCCVRWRDQFSHPKRIPDIRSSRHFGLQAPKGGVSLRVPARNTPPKPGSLGTCRVGVLGLPWLARRSLVERRDKPGGGRARIEIEQRDRELGLDEERGDQERELFMSSGRTAAAEDIADQSNFCP